MFVNMSSAQQNNDITEVFDHVGYDLTNQLDTLLNSMSDSNIVQLSKTRCKEIQEQYSNEHISKKEQETNLHKNFHRLINETKPCDNSKNSLANESFHKPTEPVRFGRRAMPLGIDAEYENVIHSINESSLTHERWSTTRLPTTEDTNRSYQINIELPLSDSKNRVNNNNNNNASSNSNDNLSAMSKNSKITNVERATAWNDDNKDSLCAEHVERRRSRRPTITSVAISPLHHTHSHGSTSKDEFKMSQTYSKRASGKAKNTDVQSMKLPYIASSNAAVSNTTTSSTEGAFATHKITENENKRRPSVDLLSLKNAKTQKVHSSHLAPMITAENNKSVNNNENDNFKKDHVNNVIDVVTATTSVSHPILNTTKAEVCKELGIDNTTAEEVAISIKLTSEEESMYDLHHFISDAHDNNTDEHDIDLNKTVESVNKRYEIEKEIRETVPVGKVCVEIAKFNAKLPEDANANNVYNNKTNDRNNHMVAKNETWNNVQESLKESTADVKYNKTHTDNVIRDTYISSSATAADTITNSGADNNIIKTTTIIRNNKYESEEYNHSAAIAHELNIVEVVNEKVISNNDNNNTNNKYDDDGCNHVKETSPQLHENGFNDNREDKCGLTTSRESSRRKSDNVNPAVIPLPLKSTTHNVNLTMKNLQDKNIIMELRRSKKQQPVLNRENLLHNEKNTNKIVNGDGDDNAATAVVVSNGDNNNGKTEANAVTMNDVEGKRYNTDKRYLSVKKECAEEPGVRSRLLSRRVLMSATDTSSLSIEHSQKDAATLRAKLMAWQDVCLFSSNLPWQPVKVNELQTRKRDSKEDNSTGLKFNNNSNYIISGSINKSINVSNVNDRKSLVTCHQRYPAMYSVNADGSRSGWVEIAGEAVEMDARLHNILAQLHHYNRTDQTEYPAQLPMTVDLVQHRRRPHTPRSFYGASGPILGASWFKGALDNIITINSPNLTSLEQKEEIEKAARRGLVDNRRMYEGVDSNKNNVNNFVYEQNAYIPAINVKEQNNNVDNVICVNSPSKPINTRYPFLDMAVFNITKKETSQKK